MFHDGPDGAAATEPVEVLTQLVRPAAVIASQERAQVAFKKVVQQNQSGARGQLVSLEGSYTAHLTEHEGSMWWVVCGGTC